MIKNEKSLHKNLKQSSETIQRRARQHQTWWSMLNWTRPKDLWSCLDAGIPISRNNSRSCWSGALRSLQQHLEHDLPRPQICEQLHGHVLPREALRHRLMCGQVQRADHAVLQPCHRWGSGSPLGHKTSKRCVATVTESASESVSGLDASSAVLNASQLHSN